MHNVFLYILFAYGTAAAVLLGLFVFTWRARRRLMRALQTA
jgi:hypothetical protein